MHESYFLRELFRILFYLIAVKFILTGLGVSPRTRPFNVVKVGPVRGKDDLAPVIEVDAGSSIEEEVPHSVLSGVVDPRCDPDIRLGCLREAALGSAWPAQRSGPCFRLYTRCSGGDLLTWKFALRQGSFTTERGLELRYHCRRRGHGKCRSRHELGYQLAGS